MGIVDDAGQKIRGKLQKMQGDIYVRSGHGVKGGIQKMKGSVNDTLASMKIRSRHRRRRHRNRNRIK